MNKLEEAAREYASCEVSEGGLDGLRGIEAGKIEPFIAGAQWQSKQSPWISVKERLPDNDDDLYIVLDTKLKPHGCGVCEFNLDINKWVSVGGIIVNPTHWMPIPIIEK